MVMMVELLNLFHLLVSKAAELKDDNGDIRFTKVMKFCLLRFDCDCPVDDGTFGPQRPPLNIWE